MNIIIDAPAVFTFYFIIGIPWQILRYAFQTRTAGRLNSRYNVESRPAAPPIIAIIITPRLILIPTFPFVYIYISSHQYILMFLKKTGNDFAEPLTRFCHEINGIFAVH